MKNRAQVIIPENHPNPPDKYERHAAKILAKYFNAVVEFIIPVNFYKQTTVDVLINGQFWEIKTPDGNSRNTIHKQFRRASKQKAEFMVINLEQTDLDLGFVKKEIKLEMQSHHRIRKVLLIAKDKTIFAFEK